MWRAGTGARPAPYGPVVRADTGACHTRRTTSRAGPLPVWPASVQAAPSNASSAASHASSAAATSRVMAASRVFAAVTSAARPGA